MNEKKSELQDEAILSAADHIREQRKKNENTRVIACCLTVVICIAIVFGTILGIYSVKKQQETIQEQQYALNMQYSSLMEYVAGAEITTETYEANSDGDGSISIAGDNNITAGGDVNGK